MGLASMEYGQQFVLTCGKGGASLFPYPGPACSRIEGMSFDIHRDNWSSNYLNHDDPQDPSNAGLLFLKRFRRTLLHQILEATSVRPSTRSWSTTRHWRCSTTRS
ncbi:hypothetical protein [Archangium sp.]|uniref:hypothetical protein n=1 Tax=Archangium sp. TaxID=1872627 RepID=UPI002D2FE69F|nr:hypothetical protein [Archangium sp.]HYO58867.1 hypothetical protein [Archangium sp.]